MEETPLAAHRPTPAGRRPLNRRRVLERALAHVDSHGLDGLSMRRLATDLDVEAMALYKHVADKDDLLASLAELVWEEIAQTAAARDDWVAWLWDLGHAVRASLHRHHRALPALVARDIAPTTALQLFDAQLQRFDAQHLPTDDKIDALRTVIAFAIGYTTCELSCFGQPTSRRTPEPESQRVRRIARTLPRDTPDHLVDVAVAVCGYDADDGFTSGLGLIIRGFAGPSTCAT